MTRGDPTGVPLPPFPAEGDWKYHGHANHKPPGVSGGCHTAKCGTPGAAPASAFSSSWATKTEVFLGGPWSLTEMNVVWGLMLAAAGTEQAAMSAEPAHAAGRLKPRTFFAVSFFAFALLAGEGEGPDVVFLRDLAGFSLAIAAPGGDGTSVPARISMRPCVSHMCQHWPCTATITTTTDQTGSETWCR